MHAESHCGLFFCYVASYVVQQICQDIYATGFLEVALVGQKIFETGLSTLNISRVKRARNTINFVDMRLVLVF